MKIQAPWTNALVAWTGICFLVLSILGEMSVAAVSAPDFVATYDITNETYVDSGRVNVTLVLRLRNFSGQDLVDAEVKMVGAARLPEDAKSFDEKVNVASGAQARVTGTFLIRPSELKRWRDGSGPILRLHYFNSQGRLKDTRIGLSYTPDVGV